MIIELIGESAIKIQSKDSVLILSPETEKQASRLGKIKADCVVLQNPCDKISAEPNDEKLFIIDSAGEYEQSGIFVYCVQNPERGKVKSLMSLVKIEGISIAHLSGIDSKLTQKQAEIFEGADILIVPVGGGDVLDAKSAKEIVETIEPRIVIPMCFSQKQSKENRDDVEKFFKEIGVSPEPKDKVKITKTELPQETMEVIYLVR